MKEAETLGHINIPITEISKQISPSIHSVRITNPNVCVNKIICLAINLEGYLGDWVV